MTRYNEIKNIAKILNSLVNRKRDRYGHFIVFKHVSLQV